MMVKGLNSPILKGFWSWWEEVKKAVTGVHKKIKRVRRIILKVPVRGSLLEKFQSSLPITGSPYQTIQEELLILGTPYQLFEEKLNIRGQRGFSLIEVLLEEE